MLADLPTFAPWVWVLLYIAALFVGLSKTAFPGINTISIAIMASVMSAKESTGALLILLIVGDVFAMWAYRKHANWPALVRLIPAVLVGLLVGVWFLAIADDFWVRKAIGIVLLLVITFTIIRGRRSSSTAPRSRLSSLIESGSYGSLSGFTTMVANAGGPVMAMYFLAMRFEVKAFLGTAAWFFMIVNLTKVPFSVGLGIITWPSLQLDLVLVPGVIIGAFIGRAIAGRMNQTFFDRFVIVLTILGALYLIVV